MAEAQAVLQGGPRGQKFPFQLWMETTGLPVYRGHAIDDLRTIDLSNWADRDVKAALTELDGQEGISSGRVEELAPGQSQRPVKLLVDELVYVLDGQGVAAVWTEGNPKKTVEFSARSLFMLPGNAYHQLTNMQGDRPVRLLFYSFMPLAMSTMPNTKFMFDSQFSDDERLYGVDNLYSEARQFGGSSRQWTGNFFPDLAVWDKLGKNTDRGAGGASVGMKFPGSEIRTHMSVFPSRTYKKAHRHGPGRLIVIPGGDGYSIIWREGYEKTILHWKEATAFTPPDRWFHQHFNLGSIPARYLAFHPPEQFSGYERVDHPERDQIEYVQEDPFIREYFESELAKRGLKSLMPDESYKNPDYKFTDEIGDD